MDYGYSICFNKWALDKNIKNELGLLLIISSLCAERGYCFASNKYLADLFDVTEVSISMKLKKLEKKNYIEIEYEKRGCEVISRKIRLKNFLIDDLKKFKPTVKRNFKENNISNNNISNNNKKIYKKSFEDIWKLYPNKKGKENAYKDFVKAIKQGTSVEEIQKGLENYNKYIEIEKIEQKYIKHGSTWFHQHCWNDDYTIKRKITTKDLAKNIDFSDVL